MSETPMSRFAQNEQAAQATIVANAEAEAYVEATELRRNSPEVAALNDLAELEIFGSRGRTYRTYANPETGAVIASPEEPLTGKLDEIQTSRRYGNKEADRKAAVKGYKRELQGLQDSGLELTQAKLVLDLHEERNEGDQRLFNKLVGQYVQTDTKEDAQIRATKKLAERQLLTGNSDAFAQRVIREKNIYSREEFDAFKETPEYNDMLRASIIEARDASDQRSRDEAAAEQQRRDDAAAQNNQPQGPNNTPPTPAEQAAIDNHELRLQHARTLSEEYLRRSAGRARRSVQKGDFKKEEVAEARLDYEQAFDEFIASEADLMRQNGATDAEIQARLDVVNAEEHLRLATRLREHRLVATGNYQFNDQAVATEVQKGIVGRQTQKFYEWYGRVNAGGKWYSKGAFKKYAAMAAIGTAVAIPVGLAIAPLTTGFIGAGLGVGIANRVTRAYMSTHINKRSQDANEQHAGIQTDELLGHDLQGTMPDRIDTQVQRETNRNRRRAATVIGVSALSGFAGSEIAHAISGGNGGHHTAAKHNSPKHSPATPKAKVPATTSPATPGKGLSSGSLKPAPAPGAGAVDGFQENVTVEAGHGYTNELQDLFAQKGDTLSGAQSFNLYNHLVEKFPNLHGNFLTNDPSYVRPQGDFGISAPGNASWNPAVLEEIANWTKKNQLN